MASFTFVPLGAGKGPHGQGTEDWDNAFTYEYASLKNAIKYGLALAAPGQYAAYQTILLPDGGTGRNQTYYRGVAYRKA